MTAVAQATQLALLPPLPPEMTGIGIAARYRSATREVSVGGDLYEIIPTGHGIRVIIGDVRGKGLDAIMLARHVLSAFRRSAVAVPAMEQVAGEVSRAIRPVGDTAPRARTHTASRHHTRNRAATQSVTAPHGG